MLQIVQAEVTHSKKHRGIKQTSKNTEKMLTRLCEPFTQTGEYSKLEVFLAVFWITSSSSHIFI